MNWTSNGSGSFPQRVVLACTPLFLSPIFKGTRRVMSKQGMSLTAPFSRWGVRQIYGLVGN